MKSLTVPPMINWEAHRYCIPVAVTFSPRESYNGQAAMPDLLARAGEALQVVPLWLMDDDDPYPGEWALGAPGGGELLGRSWIASGDVSPCASGP